MAIKTKTQLKAYFQTGSKPTQAQFEDLIDSTFNETDPLAVIFDNATNKAKNRIPMMQNGIMTNTDLCQEGDWLYIDKDALSTNIFFGTWTNGHYDIEMLSMPKYYADDTNKKVFGIALQDLKNSNVVQTVKSIEMSGLYSYSGNSGEPDYSLVLTSGTELSKITSQIVANQKWSACTLEIFAVSGSTGLLTKYALPYDVSIDSNKTYEFKSTQIGGTTEWTLRLVTNASKAITKLVHFNSNPAYAYASLKRMFVVK